MPPYQRATKLLFLPKEYREINEKFRVKINAMHEVMYKKGYNWFSTISVSDCEIIPLGSKPEEKMQKLSENFKEMRRQETEDDFLF